MNLKAALIISVSMMIASAEHHEICNGKELQVTCPENDVILIESALYGRMRLGECVTQDYGHLGCENDAMGLADTWCSGQRECYIEVPNDDLLEKNEDCGPDLSLYVDLEYSCIGVSPSPTTCSRGSKIKLSENEGYISSHVTQQTGCGGPNAPWEISARPGQTVELSLVDFGALGRTDGALLGVGCPAVYGHVVERSLGVNRTICGRYDRRGLLYTSKTNTVEIHVERNPPAHFLIQYTLVGCVDLVPPPDTWYRRDGGGATIGCKADDRRWTLSCHGNTWEGQVGNCTGTGEEVVKGESDQPEGNMWGSDIDLSTVIVVTAVVCGTVLMMIALVVAGVVYIKKQRIKHEVSLRSEYGAATLPPNFFTTNKNPGYDLSTMKSNMTSSAPPPGGAEDNQPLVHIWERSLPLAPVGNSGVAHMESGCTAPRQVQTDLLR